jgi:hypothetical protein
MWSLSARIDGGRASSRGAKNPARGRAPRASLRRGMKASTGGGSVPGSVTRGASAVRARRRVQRGPLARSVVRRDDAGVGGDATAIDVPRPAELLRRAIVGIRGTYARSPRPGAPPASGDRRAGVTAQVGAAIRRRGHVSAEPVVARRENHGQSHRGQSALE